MYDPDIHTDPIGGVLAEAGIDSRTVREVIADDRAIRCPERAAVFPQRRFADLVPDPRPEQAAEGGLCGAAIPAAFLPHPSRRPAR